LLTSAERIQYDGFLRRQDNSKAIKALAATGKSIKEITRSTGRSRKLVRSVLRGGDGDVFRGRIRMLETHTPMLRAEWAAGCHNGAELWRRLCDSGFRGLPRVVAEWATRQSRNEKAGIELSRAAPPARFLSRLMTTRRDALSKANAIMVAAIEIGVPTLAAARDMMEQFHRIFRTRDTHALA
jgi:transposase